MPLGLLRFWSRGWRRHGWASRPPFGRRRGHPCRPRLRGDNCWNCRPSRAQMRHPGELTDGQQHTHVLSVHHPPTGESSAGRRVPTRAPTRRCWAAIGESAVDVRGAGHLGVRHVRFLWISSPSSLRDCVRCSVVAGPECGMGNQSPVERRSSFVSLLRPHACRRSWAAIAPSGLLFGAVACGDDTSANLDAGSEALPPSSAWPGSDVVPSGSATSTGAAAQTTSAPFVRINTTAVGFGYSAAERSGR